jgi:multiple sugar transport system substrate-binding protein
MIGRRTFVTASAAALAAPALVFRVGAQSAFDWQQCKGQTITVSLTKMSLADNLQAHQKEFEALTGIRVLSEQMPEQQQRPKMVMELASGSPSFDVMHYSLLIFKRAAGLGHWLEDLRPYLANPKLTAPDYDWADMGAGAVRPATQVDGRIDSLPLESDVWLLYYNKQIFKDRGLEVPKTFDEMLATARKITDKEKGIYGIVGRGMKNANVPLWTSILLGQDQEAVTPDGTTLLTDTPAAIWAGEMYKALLQEAPPGVVGFNWNECQTSFMQGKVGMWMDGVGFTAPLLDPKVSKIVDHVGFGIIPAGPKGHFVSVFPAALGIPAKSRTKEAAYLYCQWATSKQMELNMVRMGGGGSPRISTYGDPGLLQNNPFGREWLETLLGSVRIARSGLPEIVPVTEFRDVFGIGLTNMLQGADVATELRKATEAFKPVLANSLKT